MYQQQETKDTYLGNDLIKKAGALINWTPELIQEYKKCMDNPRYFIEKYMKVVNVDDGLVSFDLYKYQKKLINHFKRNRFSIVLACRQSGKSITAIGYLLHYACFNQDKTIAILANKGDIAREMLQRFATS